MIHFFYRQFGWSQFVITAFLNKLSLIFLIFLFGCNNPQNSRFFNFIYEVNVDASNNKKLELWIPIPSTNEVQIISNLKIDTDRLDYQMLEESKYNNQYLYIYALDGTTESKSIKISFDVKRFEHSNVNYNDINPDDYLSSYTMVPVGDAFDNVINDNNLISNNIKSIYDFVLSGMHYGKPKNKNSVYYNNPWLSEDGKYGMKHVSRDIVVDLYEKALKSGSSYTFGNGNAIYACDIGVGNCTDYHSYFMSLTRTVDIPSRFHMGFPIPEDKEGTVKGYHCWADYYVNNEGWYPVDISEADKNPDKADYFFGTVCNNRLEMIHGRDFEIKSYENNPVNLFIYPLLEINDLESNKFTKVFSYKNIY